MYRASTHAEISVESSADKHSYETVDKPILIMHTMTCIVPVLVTPRHQNAVENSLLVTLIARVCFQIVATLYPVILDRCSATVARS